jgi:hypothetical protein
MKAIRLALGSFLFVTLFSSIATAQAPRTFVSGLGSDSNPCSRTAPCRTFSRALMGTSAGGEVVALDSAGYGAFAITQEVSVIAPPGVYAGISVFSGDGIDVNAASTDEVILRGLTINNQGSTGNGIAFNTGGTLQIENCVVNGFLSGGSAGVLFNGPGKLEVKDSIMRGNGRGIFVIPSSGQALAAIEQVRLEGGGTGLDVEGDSNVTVRNSIASGNGIGFLAESLAATAAELNLENCVASNNSVWGIVAGKDSTGAVTVRVSNSTVTHNVTGLSTDGTAASLLSRGNNTVEGNGTDGSFTGPYSAK